MANLNEECVLITGGTGLVGQIVSKQLSESGYRVIHLSRSENTTLPYEVFKWDITKNEIDTYAVEQADHIIHLAGAGVADKKWTAERKQEILSSRVDSARLLREYIQLTNKTLKSFVSASAIGYYGMDTGDALVTESSDRGYDFLADVVVKWEEEVFKISKMSIRTAAIRVGIVLSADGGALEKLCFPIKYYLGAALASGRQYLSWIHVKDLAGMFKFLIESDATGIFNGVAPNPVTNSTLTKEIASVMRRPLVLPNVPSFALKMMLGEFAGSLIGGNKVSSAKIEELGFKFEFPTLKEALPDLLNR